MAARSRTPLALLVLVVVLLALLRRWGGRRGPLAALTGRAGSLRYRVPVGQDPAAVIAALRQAGYEVRRDQGATHLQEIEVQCPQGVDRERARVRSVIAQAPIDLPGGPAPAHAAVFADEPGPTPQTI